MTALNNFWIVGNNYFIRTISMHHIGKLKCFSDKELIFTNASWIADSGRLHDALREGTLDEVEPFINDVLINRESIVDATLWIHSLPDMQK